MLRRFPSFLVGIAAIALAWLFAALVLERLGRLDHDEARLAIRSRLVWWTALPG